MDWLDDGGFNNGLYHKCLYMGLNLWLNLGLKMGLRLLRRDFKGMDLVNGVVESVKVEIVLDLRNLRRYFVAEALERIEMDRALGRLLVLDYLLLRVGVSAWGVPPGLLDLRIY